MNPKTRANIYLKKIKNSVIHDVEARMILQALIINGTIHADEIWNAKKLIDAYESVMNRRPFLFNGESE